MPMSIKPLLLPRRTIAFMVLGNAAMVFSFAIVLVSLTAIIVRGLNLSMEFTGGTALEFRFSNPIQIEALDQNLKESISSKLVLAYLGSEQDVLIRSPSLTDNELSALIQAVRVALPDTNVELRLIDNIGPQVAGEMRDQAIYAVLIALGLLLLYISFRFQFKFSVGAVVALIHDVIIVVGAFAIMQWEFSLSVFAAVLTVIGYSLNDTIVIFDRIRENIKRLRGLDAVTIVNISLTQTLERTLITVATTLVVVISLLITGGEVFRGFAIALLIGLIIGTYSSLYIAANILLKLKLSRLDLLTPTDRDQLQLDIIQ